MKPQPLTKEKIDSVMCPEGHVLEVDNHFCPRCNDRYVCSVDVWSGTAVADLKEAVEGLKKELRTKSNQAASDIGCLTYIRALDVVDKWFPYTHSQDEAVVGSAELDKAVHGKANEEPSDSRKDGTLYSISLMPLGKDYYEAHTYLVKKRENPLEFFTQGFPDSDKVFLSQPTPSKASVATDAIESNDAPLSGKKYASCPVLIGAYCSKHGVTHKNDAPTKGTCMANCGRNGSNIADGLTLCGACEKKMYQEEAGESPAVNPAFFRKSVEEQQKFLEESYAKLEKRNGGGSSRNTNHSEDTLSSQTREKK